MSPGLWAWMESDHLPPCYQQGTLTNELHALALTSLTFLSGIWILACTRTLRARLFQNLIQDPLLNTSLLFHAVGVGFEPTEPSPAHKLSRQAPSATRRPHHKTNLPVPLHVHASACI